MATTIDTSSYQPSGFVLGQLIVPQAGTVDADRRIPVVIGRGSRLATVRNLQIRRSFISGETLTFAGPPFRATLAFPAKNDKTKARLFSGDHEVPLSQWSFESVNGSYQRILINTEAYDSGLTYQIDYQSVSRDPKDPLPIDGLRSVVAIGSGSDKPEFLEYQHYFFPSTFTAPTGVEVDGVPVNTNSAATVETPTAASANTGTGVVAQNAASAFNHAYNRYYSATVQAAPVAGAAQVFTLTVPVKGSLDNNDTLVLYDGINTATTFEFNVSGPFTPVAGTVIDISGTASDIAVADLIRTAILDKGPTLLYAPDAAGSATLVLTHRVPGAFGGTAVSSDAQLIVAAGAIGTDRAATFRWTAAPMSGGNEALPPTPLTSADAASYAFTVSQASAPSLNPTLELGVQLALDFGAVLAVSGVPTLGERLAVRIGSLAKCFEFKPVASGGTQSAVLANGCINIVGTTAATVATSLATALALAVSGLPLTVTQPDATSIKLVLTTPGSVLHIGSNMTNVALTDNFVAGDAFTFNGLGAARFEVDARHANTNQYATIETPVRTASGTASLTAVAKALLVNGETFTVYDGTNTASVFEFDTDGAVTEGHFAVDISNAVSAADVAQVMKTAITNVLGSLLVTASVAVGTPTVVTLTHDQNGTILVSDAVTNVGFVHTSSLGTVSVAATAAYNGAFNSSFTLKCTSISGPSTPGATDRVATFIWAEHGDRRNVTGTFTATQATAASLLPTLVNGVILSIGFGTTNGTTLGNFAVGDTFTVAAKAPRELYQAKDTRTYTLSVTDVNNSAPATGVVRGYVGGSYVTNTPEGSFGTFEAQEDSYSAANALHTTGHFTLPGNVNLAARNLYKGPVTAQAGNRHTANTDEHTFGVSIDGVIDWNLVEPKDETIQATAILNDLNGRITGAPNTRYVILSRVPTSITAVTKTGNPISYVWLTGTPYVYFTANPAAAVRVQYTWRSAEPDPDTVYYFSANYRRPDATFNTPHLITSKEAGRQLLAPSEVTNDLYIANELMWTNSTPAVYYVQVQDLDEDGVFTGEDFKTAITASEPPSKIRDVIVLNAYQNWGDVLASLDRQNDPFAAHERIGWFGPPIGMPIGDEDTAYSMIHEAKHTMQVFGESPSHGTRVMVGVQEAVVDLQLQDRRTVQVTVDGSFFAAAVAARFASFTDPATDLLRTKIYGFRSVTTYGSKFDPRNLALGAAQIIFATEVSSGVYQLEEDVTCDNYAEDFKMLNQMAQKQWVTAAIRDAGDEKLPSLVVPSPRDGEAAVRGFIASALGGLLSRGKIAPYQDDNGNLRKFDPTSDVIVYVDSNDSSLYRFAFVYFLRKTIKRVWGTYSVNANDFGKLRASLNR